MADLQLYVRQEHAERDAAALGRQVLDAAVDADDVPDAAGRDDDAPTDREVLW